MYVGGDINTSECIFAVNIGLRNTELSVICYPLWDEDVLTFSPNPTDQSNIFICMCYAAVISKNLFKIYKEL